jgi:Lon protease-like protein
MTNFIPIFPLKIVVFPGEQLNLHIFEPRYKQMIQDCLEEKKPFGLPPVVGNDLQNDLGTLLEIEELAHTYPNGEMDIRTRGTAVFRMLHRMSNIPSKLYEGAIVNYPENTMEAGDSQISKTIVQEVRRMYKLLDVFEKFPGNREEMRSYEIGHLVGLTLQEEYELLGLFNELQRLEYLRRHLSRIVPVVQQLESLKERVQRNGHFRDLSLGDIG